jgi:hypothetical protein
MGSSKPAFIAVLVSLFTAGLAGCGGGAGASSAGMQVVPPAVATARPASGPVTYLQNSGALVSSGSIIAGTHQALIAIMSGASNVSSFRTDTLSVSTGAGTQSSTRALASRRSSAVPMHLAPVEAFPADDRVLQQRVRQLASAADGAQARGTQARGTQSVLPANIAVGTAASIWVERGSLSGSRVNVQVPARVAAQTEHANIWIDATLTFTPDQIAQIGADVENAYTSDTAHFASPDYASNAPGMQPRFTACAPGGAKQGTAAAYITQPADRRIDVMVVNSANLGGIGGYFTGANLMKQSVLNCLNGSGNTYESNEAPFIFVGWFAGSGSAYELQEDLVRSTAHEFQHLINFVNHAILAPGASSPSFDGNEPAYVNEGLSMLAQDLAVSTMYGSRGVQFDVDDALARANVYLSAPQNYSLSAFSGVDPVSWGGDSTAQFNCGGGCYGAAYLFQRYLRDRFGGDAYTHAMETSGMNGDRNLQNATGESAADLYGDFALAMSADTLGVTSADPRFRFGSLDIAGMYSDQFGVPTQLGGLYSVPFSSSSDVSAPIGGFTFVSLQNVPSSGTQISVSDHATVPGFSLEGGLAQK